MSVFLLELRLIARLIDGLIARHGQRGHPGRDLVHHRVKVAVADPQRWHNVFFTHLIRARARVRLRARVKVSV